MPNPKGRPNRGRTETLKQRAVYIYAPTEKMLAKWRSEAKRFGMSLSSFLVETIDDAMRKAPSGLTPRKKLEEDLQLATSNLAAVRTQRDSMRTRLDESEVTIARYRESLEDVLSYLPDEKLQERVISLFLRRARWQIDDFLRSLKIDPGKPEDLKKVQGVVEHLKRIGLVEGDFGEWRWLGGYKSKRVKASPEVEGKRRRARHKRLSRRLQAARNDSAVGSILRFEPE